MNGFHKTNAAIFPMQAMQHAVFFSPQGIEPFFIDVVV